MNEVKVRHGSGLQGTVDAFDFYILEAFELDFEDENGNHCIVRADELEVGL